MPPPKPVRILLVDDHPIFREGLSMVIQSQPDLLLVGQAENADDALSQFRRIRPDVTIMDQKLPGASGTDALIAIRKGSPRAIMMMVTTSKKDMDVRRALNAGAAAYVLKNTPKAEMLRVIRWVSEGRRHIPSEVASAIAEHLGQEELFRVVLPAKTGQFAYAKDYDAIVTVHTGTGEQRAFCSPSLCALCTEIRKV